VISANPPSNGSAEASVSGEAYAVTGGTLLPAPDTDPNPHPPVLREEGGVASASPGSGSANEAQLRQDRPPHW